MLAIVGYVIVFGAVFGGFAVAGGHLGAMFQPLEFLIIAGRAFGAFVIGNSGKSLKSTLSAIPACFKGSKYTKAIYMELMALLYDLLQITRKEGLMAIERDVDSPKESAIFGKY